MLAKTVLQQLNEWFGCYLANEKIFTELNNYIDNHPNDSIDKFLSKHERKIDEIVHTISQKSIKDDFSKDYVQSLLSDTNVAFGLYLRHALFSEYLEQSPEKDILISNYEPQFIIDCFINYPREILHSQTLL